MVSMTHMVGTGGIIQLMPSSAGAEPKWSNITHPLFSWYFNVTILLFFCSGGLKALRRGGCLVYTTSTLSPNQNDEVVETALRRLHQDPEVDSEFAVCDLESLATDFYEAKILRFARGQCKYGQLVIPFLPNNYGPVYTCKLKRLQWID